MSLRSLIAAGKDGYSSARAPKTGDADESAAPVPAGVGIVDAAVTKGMKWTEDQKWNALGGPWMAQYRRNATAAAIGIGEGEPHKVHFMDPLDALAHFRGLPDHYRTNDVLRRECLITYKDNWYAVEPFAADAHHAVEVMRAEVARDVRSGAAT